HRSRTLGARFGQAGETAGPSRGCAGSRLRVTTRHSAKLVSLRGIGSANGNRTRWAPVQFGSVGSKWLCFQYSWYPEMVRNTTTDRRRHSAVTAQPWSEGRRLVARWLFFDRPSSLRQTRIWKSSGRIRRQDLADWDL